MQYSQGRIGRVFTIRFDDGEDFLAELERFVRTKDIQTGTVQFLGALREGQMVAGPKEPVIPPVPHHEDIYGGWEILGFATIYPGLEGPAIHLHATAGRGMKTVTGCLRKKAEIYLVVEAVLTEIINVRTSRVHDEKTGVLLPVFEETLEPEPETPPEKEAAQ
jgi:predicted DNA-binding protein with PD1-like motif